MDYFVKKSKKNRLLISKSFFGVPPPPTLFENLYIFRIDLHFFKKNSSIHNVLIEISKMGPHEIILTLGSKGSLIYSAKENNFYEINPIKPTKIIDPVGCGDTYIASYLYARSNHYCIEDAGNFAAKIASHKLGQKGAYSGNIKNTIINT